jgi:hypothetical protein
MRDNREPALAYGPNGGQAATTLESAQPNCCRAFLAATGLDLNPGRDPMAQTRLPRAPYPHDAAF